jgi:hypothetical protein
MGRIRFGNFIAVHLKLEFTACSLAESLMETVFRARARRNCLTTTGISTILALRPRMENNEINEPEGSVGN